MTVRRPFALLLLIAMVLMAAMPALALAQSAGDDQYQDPLGPGGGGGGDTPPSTPPSGGGGGGGSGAPTPAPTPAPSAGAAQAPSQGDTGSASSSNVPLARTGFPALVPGIAGVLLLAGGIALLRGPRREARRL